MAEQNTYSITIRERHVDSYGHLNNATYLELFEEARWEMITRRGMGFQEVHKAQQGPVLLEVNLRFKKEIGLRETITITTELLDYEGKIGHLRQQMIKEDGSLAAEATFAFGIFDIRERKLIRPDARWIAALGLSEQP